MAYLHSDREQFRDAIDLAYEQTGVMVQAIEKIIMLRCCCGFWRRGCRISFLRAAHH